MDRLVITAVPEGCPGDDWVQHTVVYDSATDGDPADFAEPVIPAQTAGPLRAPLVGPFPVSALIDGLNAEVARLDQGLGPEN